MQNTHTAELPPAFQHDDVRFSDNLVRHFLQHFTQERDIVLDPFAGFGTTLMVAEAMGRIPYGIEWDAQRANYIRSQLRHPDHIIHGDAQQLNTYGLPAFDFSITSPPYMRKNDTEDPLTGYALEGRGYSAYLQDLRGIYLQMAQLMKDHAHVVIEVANLKAPDSVTRLAWDIADVVSEVLHFEGEVVIGWDTYGYGYDHSYCLVFTSRKGTSGRG